MLSSVIFKPITLAEFVSFLSIFLHFFTKMLLLTLEFFLALPRLLSLLSPKNFGYLSWLLPCYNVKVKISTVPSVPHATLDCLHLISFPCVPQLTFHIPHSPLTLLLLLSAFHALIFALSFMLPMCLEQSLASQPIYSFA